MKHCIIFSKTLTAAMLMLAAGSMPSLAQNETKDSKPHPQPTESITETSREAPAKGTNEGRIAQSIAQMIRRAGLLRSVAGQHIFYTTENSKQLPIKQTVDATEVIAFNRLCEASGLDPARLQDLASYTTLNIATLMQGKSSVADRLTSLIEKQTVSQRADLLADASSAVFMFEIGRRRGLFEAISTDFSKTRFCASMKPGMENRFNRVIGPLPPAADANPSDGYQIRRAHLVQTIAQKHLAYLNANRSLPDVRLIEDSSQVLAYDLICDTQTMNAASLARIANDATYLIAKLAANGSPTAQHLGRISQKQSTTDKVALLADVAATVLMHEIGRRRGLFDALLTDFGSKRFCMGMRADMQTRFNEMVSERTQ